MKKYTLSILVALSMFLFGVVWWSTAHRSTSQPKEAVPGYVIKNGKVYYDEVMQVQWADNKIHQQINELEVVGADAKTFTLLKSPFNAGESEIGAYEAKDAQHLYYQNQVRNLIGPASTTIDLQTLSEDAPGVYKDKNAVYTINGNKVDAVPSADVATFVVIADPKYGSPSTYAKDKNAAFFLEGGYNPDLTVTAIPGINPYTFKVIGICASPGEPSGAYGDRYNAIDEMHVLAGKDVVLGADPSTFHIVGLVDKNPDGMSSTGSYAVDKNHVYKDCGIVVPGISPSRCTADNLKECEGK